MFKKNEFRAALARAEITTTDVAKALGIDISTLSRKISGQSDFYRNEIEKIGVLLKVDWNTIKGIFLSKILSKLNSTDTAGGERAIEHVGFGRVAEGGTDGAGIADDANGNCAVD